MFIKEKYDGTLGLLILQATPFCNIDCRYCYLPNRNDTRRLELDKLATIVNQIKDDGLFGEFVEICWHAGEPLVVGIDYFRKAIRLIREIVPSSTSIIHTIQTNATLIDAEWCRFFREHNINLGISLDGPENVHDCRRVTRRGTGTFSRVMSAISELNRENVPFYVITVFGEASLAEYETVYNFLATTGAAELCFNIEESDGVNISRVITEPETVDKAGNLFRFLLAKSTTPNQKIWVRELHQMIGRLTTVCSGGPPTNSDLNTPFRIITVACDGGWSTFSPELLGTPSAAYGNFVFGNLLNESVFDGACREVFQNVHREIERGIRRCRDECEYFAVCGGGAPSNKYAETGLLSSSKTAHCRVWTKTLADACLETLEQVLSDAEATAP